MSTRSLIIAAAAIMSAGCRSQRDEVDALIGPQPSSPMSVEIQFAVILVFSTIVAVLFVYGLRSGNRLVRRCRACNFENRLKNTSCWNCGRSLR
jgi:hypothetical protein